MQNKIGYKISVLFILFLCSCSSAKRGKTVVENNSAVLSGEKILELSIQNNFGDNGVLIKNGKAYIESSLFSGNFDFYVKKNSMGDYTISGMGPLGIELIKIYGIKDSTYVIDRINKKIYAGKTTNVYSKYGLPADFMTLLFGDIPGKAILHSATINEIGEVEAFYEDKYYSREILIKRDVLRAVKTVINKNVSGESLTFSYDKFVNVEGITYPQKICIDCVKPLFHVEILVESIKSPVNEFINMKLPDFKTIGL
jgi:hypothetical protein